MPTLQNNLAGEEARKRDGEVGNYVPPPTFRVITEIIFLLHSQEFVRRRERELPATTRVVSGPLNCLQQEWEGGKERGKRDNHGHNHQHGPEEPNQPQSYLLRSGVISSFPLSLCETEPPPEKTGGGMEDGEGHFVKPAAAAAATVARGDSKKVFFLSLSISICCWTLLCY